jgi:hypothetical protein
MRRYWLVFTVAVGAKSQPDVQDVHAAEEPIPADRPVAKLRASACAGMHAISAGKALEGRDPSLVRSDGEKCDS